MNKKATSTALAGAIIIGLTVTGCAGSSQNDDVAPESCGSGEPITVNLLSAAQPVTLDANFDTLLHPLQITRNLYDGLFKLNDDMEVTPDLATDFSQPDELTYDITLREDVTFHDGSEFTSADVISTFDRILSDEELASKQRTYLGNVADYTAVDDYQVRITLTQPDASFIRTLASVIFITPAATVEEVGNVAFGKEPVGTGPFKFESWNEGDSVVLTANCDYFGDQPIPSSVEFRFIAEPATQLSSLQSGEIDIATEISPDLAAGLASSSGVEVRSTPAARSKFINLNTLEGPFADERVRQALNYAIDKESITTDLLSGYATPIGQMYGPSVFGYSEEVEPYPYDPERARELLDEAGYGEGQLKVDFVLYDASLASVQQSIASYLADVGIEVTQRTDPNFFRDTWLAQKMAPTEMFIANGNNVLLDADYNLGLTLDGARRGLYFHTPETDAAIAEARGISDVEERQAAYDELDAVLHDLAPLGFLYSDEAIFGVNDQVSWQPRADAAIYLADVTKGN